MRFSVDHDFHIHSRLSRCSDDAAQTPEAMLSYAARFGLKKICVTDHFWDAPIPGASVWYRGQDLDHLRSILPLPEGEIRFCFGAETEMDRSFRLGIAPQTFDAFDFVIIPTTHLQMSGFTIQEGASEADRARLWVERLDALRIYRLAKEAGCRFYLGSDAHHPRAFDRAAENFEHIIGLLDLQESDKFDFE